MVIPSDRRIRVVTVGVGWIMFSRWLVTEGVVVGWGAKVAAGVLINEGVGPQPARILNNARKASP